MNNATEATAAPIAPQEDTTPVLDDVEARFQQLEDEKENYRKAYLKAVGKPKEEQEEPVLDDEENKMMRVAQKVLADSRLAEINREQDALIKKTLKENKELKLANLNSKQPPTAMGTHSEEQGVRDTLITPDQMNHFKNVLKWDDAKIERYKKNLLKRI